MEGYASVCVGLCCKYGGEKSFFISVVDRSDRNLDALKNEIIFLMKFHCSLTLRLDNKCNKL